MCQPWKIFPSAARINWKSLSNDDHQDLDATEIKLRVIVGLTLGYTLKAATSVQVVCPAVSGLLRLTNAASGELGLLLGSSGCLRGARAASGELGQPLGSSGCLWGAGNSCLAHSSSSLFSLVHRLPPYPLANRETVAREAPEGGRIIEPLRGISWSCGGDMGRELPSSPLPY